MTQCWIYSFRMVVLIQYSRPISKSNILFTIITNQTSKFRLSSENTNIPKGRRKPKRSGWKPLGETVSVTVKEIEGLGLVRGWEIFKIFIMLYKCIYYPSVGELSDASMAGVRNLLEAICGHIVVFTTERETYI